VNNPFNILPAILTDDAETFRERLTFPGFWKSGMTAHVDILDGTLFDATCFCEPEHILHERHANSFPSSLELHCMVRNPIPVIERWKTLVPETARAIVHAEIDRPLDPLLRRIHDFGLEAGVAICPETATTIVETLAPALDRVLIMGVAPGASGRQFLGEPIRAKLRRLHACFPDLPLCVDGGVRRDNVHVIQAEGASSVVVGSAIWNTPHPKQSYIQFIHENSSR
jgi:ribulose-phosphate 3-epimerase